MSGRGRPPTHSEVRARRPLATRGRRLVRAALLFPILVSSPTVHAETQTWVPPQGHGTMSIGYQDLYISTHTLSDGTYKHPGNINNHSVFLDLDYGLTDRLALHLTLPYKSNRFVGPKPHVPGHVDGGHGEQFVDDGQYHAGWQDWNIGLRYQWRDRPWSVTPFVSFGYPSHDYTTFGHAALGTRQWQLQLGLNVGRRLDPPFQNFYFQAGYAYSILEKVEHRRVNHSTLNLEAGYFLSPQLSISMLITMQKTHNGFDFPEDYPNNHDEHFFHHDENLRNDFINRGTGVTYLINDHFAVYSSYGRSMWGENAHLIDHAITVGVSRSF